MTFGPKESRDAMRRQANVSKFLGTRGNDDLFAALTDGYREAAPREDTLSSAPYRARVRAQKSSRHRLPVPVSHARELRARTGETRSGLSAPAVGDPAPEPSQPADRALPLGWVRPRHYPHVACDLRVALLVSRLDLVEGVFPGGFPSGHSSPPVT